MNTYIALFRGINVGGRNILPMAELRALLENLGCSNVQTYIQSGNVVLQHPGKAVKRLSAQIGGAVNEQYGFEPAVLILTHGEMKKAVEANPFPDAEADPRSLHLMFLYARPRKPDLKGLEAVKAPSERFKLKDKVFYLHAPDGVARSKLTAGIDRLLGVSITGRNWRTVCKLLDMAASG
jgi:uncharacterized protein (DUF1697 family)